jgi:hypothetical protein
MPLLECADDTNKTFTTNTVNVVASWSTKQILRFVTARSVWLSPKRHDQTCDDGTQVYRLFERLKMHTPGLSASFSLSDPPTDKPFTTRTAQHWNHEHQHWYYGHLQHWSHPGRNFAFPDVAAVWAQDEGFEQVLCSLL